MDAPSPLWARERLERPGGELTIEPAGAASLVDARGGYRFALAGGATSVAVCAGTSTALTGEHGVVRAWDLRTGEERWSREVGAQLTLVAMDEEGARGIVTTADGILRLELVGGQPLGGSAPIRHRLRSEVTSLSMSADATLAVLADRGGDVLLVHLGTAGVAPLIIGEDADRAQKLVALSRDARRIVAADGAGRLRGWELVAGDGESRVTPLPERSTEPVSLLAASPDLDVLLTADRDGGRVRRWSATGDSELLHEGGRPRALAVDPTGRRALLGDLAGELDLIDLTRPGAPSRPLPIDPAIVRAAAFVDATHAVTCDLRVLTWDLDRPSDVDLPPKNVRALTASEDGRELVVCREDTIEVWEVGADSMRCARQLPGPERDPESALLAPDGGRVLLTWDREKRARLVDLQTGAPVDVSPAIADGWARPGGVRVDVAAVTIRRAGEASPAVTLRFSRTLDVPAAAVVLGGGTLIAGTTRGALLRFALTAR